MLKRYLNTDRQNNFFTTLYLLGSMGPEVYNHNTETEAPLSIFMGTEGSSTKA